MSPEPDDSSQGTQRGTSLQILRSIGSVVAGYLLFAVSAFLFFQLSGQRPHAAAPPSIMAASILVGVIAAFAGGFLAAQLAGRRPRAHGIAVAVVLAVGAAVSLVGTLGHGAIWSQVAALVLMAPGATAGGWALRGARDAPGVGMSQAGARSRLHP